MGPGYRSNTDAVDPDSAAILCFTQRKKPCLGHVLPVRFNMSFCPVFELIVLHLFFD